MRPAQLVRGAVKERHWRLAVLDCGLDEVLAGESLPHSVVEAPSPSVFWADPYPVINDDGGRWVFAEEYDYRRGLGHIIAIRMIDGEVASVRTVLAGAHHYAFPQIHRWRGGWIATVDTCDPSAPVLAFDQPGTSWRPFSSLPAGLVDPAMDTDTDGRWILTATGEGPSGGSSCVQFRSEDDEPHEWRLIDSVSPADPRCSRGGGNLDLGRRIRVVQDVAEGYGLRTHVMRWQSPSINEIAVTLSGADFGPNIIGTHTLAWTPDGDFVVADVWDRRWSSKAISHRLLEARHGRGCARTRLVT